MPWFRIDDGWHSHPKVLELTLAAAGLWAKCGSWSAFHLTDGRVTRAAMRSLGGSAKLAAELVAAGLWVEADGGWQFHQWEQRQPTRAAVEKERLQKAARQRRWRSGDAPEDDDVDASTAPSLDATGDACVERAPARAFSLPDPDPRERESHPPAPDLEPESQRTPLEAAVSALRGGYKERFDAKTKGNWMSWARNDREMRDVARWALASAERHALGVGQVVFVALEEFFSDPKAEASAYPWPFLAKNPDEYFLRDRRVQSHIATRQQGSGS